MLTTALLAMGFLLSPRAFMITGSGIGLAGNWYFLVTAFLLATHIATIPPRTPNRKSTNADALESFGYGIRFFSLVFFSCSILGIAGYAFNEVFLYWFPNFLFSFIILTCSFFTSLAPSCKARKIQLIAIITILIGIVFLSVAALWAPSPKESNSPNFFLPYGSSPFSEGLFFMAPLLIGYELYASSSTKDKFTGSSYALALTMAALFLSIFAYAALSISGTEKLADSTVPYMIGAKKILGQNGRYIMGGIIILGSYVAFNTILLFLKAPFITLMDFHLSAQLSSSNLGKQAVATTVPALTVSILLLRGYAGEPITESYIAGGFALWFVFYGLSTIVSVINTDLLIAKLFKIVGTSSCLYLAYAVLKMSEAPLKGLIVAGVVSIVIAALGIIGRKMLLP
ncbi:hypothetical protein [Halodesulfovibrio marinisediminis]|uniref:Amino acid permease n=1 Tax=Halodesulfovibrio marinisediminis DSM 17456 TaxID=1121457 RepID=A0A1N6ECS9_9BACT|nr:hypothetical protein [Halodesulfovibrio marinisediminis]SIN80824.1 hypothetical protein SAMN02745161_0896 [Halodesulfovibrio marinisediminis DSM 17456]